MASREMMSISSGYPTLCLQSGRNADSNVLTIATLTDHQIQEGLMIARWKTIAQSSDTVFQQDEGRGGTDA